MPRSTDRFEIALQREFFRKNREKRYADDSDIRFLFFFPPHNEQRAFINIVERANTLVAFSFDKRARAR